MNKPKNYESISVGGYTPVSVGGHKCEIKQVTETKTKDGKEMLHIAFDMDVNDPQKDYYLGQWTQDKEAKKENITWRGVMYLVTDESTQYGPANLKKFNTSVEQSNEGFKFEWGEGYANCFKGKKVGVVFREEEYLKNDGTVGKSNKAFRFCDYNKAFEVEVPEPKKLKEQPLTQEQIPFKEAANAGFMQVADGLQDEGLPFM